MILHPITSYSSLGGDDVAGSIELRLLQEVNEREKICLQPTRELKDLSGLDETSCLDGLPTLGVRLRCSVYLVR